MPSPAPELINKAIRAGAGAGKTTSLVAEVTEISQQFLKQNQKPRFIVTTFTKKASHELKERLLKKALELQDSDLCQLYRSKTHLHISTIHGVLGMFLTKHGSQIGLLPSYQIVSEEADKIILKKIAKKNLADPQFVSLLETFRLGDILEILYEFLQIVLENPSAASFTTQDLQKIVNDKKQQAFGRMKRLADGILQCTDKPDWKKVSDLLSSHAAKQTIPTELKFPQNRSGAIDSDVEELRDQVKEDIELLNGVAFSEKSIQDHQQSISKFEALGYLLLPEYLSQKISLGQLTMRNLEGFTSLILDRSPQSAAEFSQDWDYWFIDEYQDTSPLQVRLIKSLMNTKKGYFVGDPQQSIYLFRGAKVELFNQLIEDFKNSNQFLGILDKNYRSEANVLNFINQISSKLGFEPMQVGSDLKPFNDSVMVTGCEPEQELNAVTQNIIRLLNQGVSAANITILANNNDSLQTLHEHLNKNSIPVFLNSAGKYFKRREILDVVLCLKVLINPHDNLSLVSLLRSPWFYLSDDNIHQICTGVAESFWVNATNSEDPLIKKVVSEIVGFKQLCQERGYFQGLLQLMKQKQVFESCAYFDSSGRREANLWKFLFLLKEFSDRPGVLILEFVEKILSAEASDPEVSETDAIPAVANDRVQMMTVHASKGLQFDHVILFHLHKRVQTAERDDLLFDRDLEKFTINLVDSDSGKKTKSVAGLFIQEKMSQAKLLEHDRLLYVALTRAKLSLNLVFSKIQRKSWADSLINKVGIDLSEGIHQLGNVKYKSLSFSGDSGDMSVGESGGEGGVGDVSDSGNSVSVIDVGDSGKSVGVGDTSDARDSGSVGVKQVLIHSEAEVPHRTVKPIQAMKHTQLISVTEWLESQVFSPKTDSLKNLDKIDDVPGQYIKDSNANKVGHIDDSKFVATSRALNDSHSSSLSKKLSSDSVAGFTPKAAESAIQPSGGLKSIEFAKLGTDIHKALEMVKYHKDHSKISKYSFYPWLKDFQSGLIFHLIQTGHVEYGFVIQQQNLRIQGQIDLWGRDQAGNVWIVDYKTGSASYADKAMLQLKMYQTALQQLGKIKPTDSVKLLALYLTEQKAVF